MFENNYHLYLILNNPDKLLVNFVKWHEVSATFSVYYFNLKLKPDGKTEYNIVFHKWIPCYLYVWKSDILL